jgi:hypothetical protein
VAEKIGINPLVVALIITVVKRTHAINALLSSILGGENLMKISPS